jgi:hypothetical protein
MALGGEFEMEWLSDWIGVIFVVAILVLIGTNRWGSSADRR